MKTVKTIFCLLLALCLCLSCAACGQSSTAKTSEKTEADAPATEAPAAPAEAGTDAAAPAEGEKTLHTVEITVKDYGTMTLVLDATAAPITVQNFLDLANQGFYDGLTFHRIMDGFMIQGGDPLGNGMGGSSTHITGEFALNGWENPISHQPGVISMARSGDPNSASSQFFICVGDASFLDGSYAAFGWTADEESLEIALQIAKDAKPVDNNGSIPKAEQPVIESVKVID